MCAGSCSFLVEVLLCVFRKLLSSYCSAVLCIQGNAFFLDAGVCAKSSYLVAGNPWDCIILMGSALHDCAAKMHGEEIYFHGFSGPHDVSVCVLASFCSSKIC